MLLNRDRDRFTCLGCNVIVPTEDEVNWVNTRGDDDENWHNNHFATQNCTCSVCLKHYCYECEVTESRYKLIACRKCKRDYCADCSAMDQCNYCGDYCCQVCNTYVPCDRCEWTICGDCNSKNKGCSDCSISYCEDCENHIRCPECYEYLCITCLTRRYNSGGSNNCSECTRRVAQFAPLFLEEMERLSEEKKVLTDEVKTLKDEITELKNAMKEMGIRNG